jgi:hypothetical protein
MRVIKKPRNEELETYACVLLDYHYQQNGVVPGWTVPQADALCGLLRCTLIELGALCAVKPGDMRRFINQRRFPPTVSLHFAILESWVKSAIYGAKQEPVMPVNLLHAEP